MTRGCASCDERVELALEQLEAALGPFRIVGLAQPFERDDLASDLVGRLVDVGHSSSPDQPSQVIARGCKGR